MEGWRIISVFGWFRLIAALNYLLLVLIGILRLIFVLVSIVVHLAKHLFLIMGKLFVNGLFGLLVALVSKLLTLEGQVLDLGSVLNELRLRVIVLNNWCLLVHSFRWLPIYLILL